jgi:hypothetical protein
MKRSIILLGLVVIIILSGCKDEKCFSCKKPSKTTKFCLPRAEAKNKRDALENNGYTCSKFKQ